MISDEQKARTRFQSYVLATTGIVPRKPCRDCGAEKVQIHHEDYTDPLNITWLCQKCHGALHGKRRREAAHQARLAELAAKAERDALPPPTPAPPMEPKVFFSTKDAAKFINKSYSWLRRARDVPGTGPIYYKIGSQCLYELPSLEAWKERTSVP